ncbi:beta-carotene ketolase [Lujinxingia litoralis]|uniref:Beta-carotene ketolase n=1 Tax=Lujinxingia litoralis TaxID=2211119 RepID=A0A328C662_9DELT|nr:fatty acid desaturase [Lujinxingia litoralis]RAL22999.1 beta-carotene ketolase [Lujinxingia litoralis]
MNTYQRPRYHSARGLLSALAILSAWSGGLALALTLPLSLSPLVLAAAPLLVALMTFLYTGLFITAHDAMHRSVAPDFPRLNHALGRLAVLLYALFSYTRLLQSHHAHHAHPASPEDPDFHDGQHPDPLRWYLHFLKGYVSAGQLVGMALVFNILHHLLSVPLPNLLLFWVLPSLLSTLQLFYFGTYLPHRRPARGYADHHRASSNDFAPWLSFLTCYHFGYHREHHQRPDIPWWALPGFRKKHLIKKSNSKPIQNT